MLKQNNRIVVVGGVLAVVLGGGIFWMTASATPFEQLRDGRIAEIGCDAPMVDEFLFGLHEIDRAGSDAQTLLTVDGETGPYVKIHDRRQLHSKASASNIASAVAAALGNEGSGEVDHDALDKEQARIQARRDEARARHLACGIVAETKDGKPHQLRFELIADQSGHNRIYIRRTK